jgi:RNA polymerase sigma-70 factor (sigma-E family)
VRPIIGDEPSPDRLRSFEDFYRNEYPVVLSLAVALCRNPAAGEDLAQDAFLALHKSWDRVSGYSDPGAWVRRVVANRSVSRWRRLASEARVLARLHHHAQVGELVLEDREVWVAVRQLPRRQAQVVALTYLEDLPVKEVAAILGIDAATVKTHLQRGRRTLAAQLHLDDGHEADA